MSKKEKEPSFAEQVSALKAEVALAEVDMERRGAELKKHWDEKERVTVRSKVNAIKAPKAEMDRKVASLAARKHSAFETIENSYDEKLEILKAWRKDARKEARKVLDADTEALRNEFHATSLELEASFKKAMKDLFDSRTRSEDSLAAEKTQVLEALSAKILNLEASAPTSEVA